MSRDLIKKYYSWFDKKITQGAEVDELIDILYIAIRSYLEDMENIIIKDDSYIFSEIISLIYKIANGKELNFTYFFNMVKRLKLNLMRNKKTIQFYNIEDLYFLQI